MINTPMTQALDVICIQFACIMALKWRKAFSGIQFYSPNDALECQHIKNNMLSISIAKATAEICTLTDFEKPRREMSSDNNDTMNVK